MAECISIQYINYTPFPKDHCAIEHDFPMGEGQSVRCKIVPVSPCDNGYSAGLITG